MHGTTLLPSIAAGLLAAGAANAVVIPAPSATDPHIQVATYAPDEVVRLSGTLGYAVSLRFDEGERVETVSIGDSLGWQITPNRRANMLFLKPIDRAPPTDMTVVTNLRVYTLELRVLPRPRAPQAALLYELKFAYPEPAMAVAEPVSPPPPPAPPRDLNHAYSFVGAAAGLPTRVFDDGVSTYFKFAEATDMPAIFAIDPDGKEAAVNVAQRQGFVVIDRLAQGFVLRRGAEVTRISNDAYRPDAGLSTTLRRGKKR
jgi:type IV secretion system protein VirB9